jgi:hypothetical protein
MDRRGTKASGRSPGGAGILEYTRHPANIRDGGGRLRGCPSELSEQVMTQDWTAQE